VGVDDRELDARLAAEQVGGTRGLVVQQLSKIHAGPREVIVTGLTSYQVIY
jgi:hypothetical protein